jgi:hypothetical protein
MLTLYSVRVFFDNLGGDNYVGENEDGKTLYGSRAARRGKKISGIGNERAGIRGERRICAVDIERLDKRVRKPARGLHPD